MAKEKTVFEAGFALPFALVVLVAISFTLSILALQVQSSQDRAAVYVNAIGEQKALITVEQELAYRALLEFYGVDRDLDPLGENQDDIRYRGAPVSGKFYIDGGVYPFESTYQRIAPPQDLPEVLVRVQDIEGLLDLNYQSEAYLTYVAYLAGVRSGEQMRAARILNEAVGEVKQEVTVDRRPVHGLWSPRQLCGLPIWKEAEICEDRARMAFTFAGRSGLLPNYFLTPQSLRDLIGPDGGENFDPGTYLAWIQTQEKYKFYDAFAESGGRGMEYVVAISERGSHKQKRFKISLRRSNGMRPFSVSEVVEELRMEEFDEFEAREAASGRRRGLRD
ncbi:MAG: hypothetical protein CMK06_05730 [Ponticaulis sp.]|mgnify:FL=1|nr:hypothetical protein [Ponticaulis sp.]|tara:strand:+ start:902 stop:1906 length:1005 start_codon:yes stop_codon:yes gene_type:complete